MVTDKVRLLLIEDSPELAELFIEQASVFTNDTFAVEVCHTLEAAIPRLRASCWDLVVVDLCLPDSTGYATFSAVHAEASGAPVFILSGLPDPELAARARANGCAGYLHKAAGSARPLFEALTAALPQPRPAPAHEASMS